MKKFMLVGSVLLMLLCAQRVKGADKLTEQVAKLTENNWVSVTPELSKRFLLQSRSEDSAVVEATSRTPRFREYTSPAFGDGKIFYFGGGHSGYFGNDVEIYDPAKNTWRQCYRPVCPPKDDSTYYSGGSERSYVDPETGARQPYVLHGYARTAFDPKLHRFVCTAMFPTKVERDQQTQKWKLVSQKFCYIAFDEKTNLWELLAEVPDSLKPGSTSLSYDSKLGGMIALSERAAYLFQDGKWNLVGDSAVRLAASGGAAAVFLPERQSHLIAVLGHGGAKEQGTLSLFNTIQKQGNSFEMLPQELQRRIEPGSGGYNLIMSYDSRQKKVVFMSVNAESRPDVWTYDVTTSKYELLPLSASAPKLMGVFEPGRGRAPLMYDPERDLFYLLYRNGESADLWAYRLPKAVAKIPQ